MNATPQTGAKGKLPRIWFFLQKPWAEKIESFHFRWARLLSHIPVPVHLSFGAWWIGRGDNVAEPLRAGTFETPEIAFVEGLLQPGMTVLDLGAHHGLYSLLASKRVGSGGRVFAFEPSSREQRVLRLHLLLNRRRNVVRQELALGETNAEADLYVVDRWAAGCNSLRPPNVPARTSLKRVRVVRLDDWLTEWKIHRVDFIKMDVEGAELGVLKGASCLLERRPRPIILTEVQDIRARPWGYEGKNILDYLSVRGYKWFQLSPNSPSDALRELDVSRQEFDGNFIACPEERVAVLDQLNQSLSSDRRGRLRLRGA
jgi:FkbM family methyltransferase